MRAQSKYMSDGLALTKQCADAATTSAMAANEQLRTMTNQLAQMESQTRPWIGLETEGGLQASPISVDEQGNARIQIRITARNFGNYPGQRVFSIANLVI